MSNLEEKNLVQFATVEPADRLLEIIVAKIHILQRRQARVRLFAMGGVMLSSFVGLVATLGYSVAGFHQSGFYQYITLIFSDGGLLLTYWRTFLLSLVESLPLLDIIAILALLFIMLESMKLTAKNFKHAF